MTGRKRNRAVSVFIAAYTLMAAVSAYAAAPAPFALGGPFALIDHTGQPKTDGDFRGGYMLVFFGYAGCEGICPVGLRQMVGAVDALGADGEIIRPVLITVEPAADAPAALGDYVRKIHPRLIGLTGPAESLRAAARAYKVEAKIIGRFPDGKPIIAHGSYIYLVGPNGRVAGLFPPVMDIASMAAAIRRYLPAAKSAKLVRE